LLINLRPSRVRDWVAKRFEVGALAQQQGLLSNWFETPFGRSVLQQQHHCSATLLSGLGGYRAAQLGISAEHSLLHNCQQAHCFTLTAACGTGGVQPSGICELTALPLPSNTIDLAVLHHTLDFSPDPHSVLNEAARVVIPGGYMVLVGFNPYSLFGLAKWPAALWSEHPVWRRNSLRAGRLRDWLRLLGFQPVTIFRGCRQLPVQNPGVLRRLGRLAWLGKLADRGRLPGGAFYMVVARKQVPGMTGVASLQWPRIPVPRFNLQLRLPEEQPHTPNNLNTKWHTN